MPTSPLLSEVFRPCMVALDDDFPPKKGVIELSLRCLEYDPDFKITISHTI